uniref:Uncharacterized protein n=1 Tax=Panagrolaimus sp. JU765 TaxID=591449 RepID=A0AC34Q4L0_9BILA
MVLQDENVNLVKLDAKTKFSANDIITYLKKRDVLFNLMGEDHVTSHQEQCLANFSDETAAHKAVIICLKEVHFFGLRKFGSKWCLLESANEHVYFFKDDNETKEYVKDYLKSDCGLIQLPNLEPCQVDQLIENGQLNLEIYPKMDENHKKKTFKKYVETKKKIDKEAERERQRKEKDAEKARIERSRF